MKTIQFITIIALSLLLSQSNSIAVSMDYPQDEVRGVSVANQQVVIRSESDFAWKVPKDEVEVIEKPVVQESNVFYENPVNACYPGQEVDHRAAYPDGGSGTTGNRAYYNALDPENSPIPNPNIASFESRFFKFDGFAQQQTIFYAGALPFLALPDANLQTDDSVFHADSFSFFLYFKRKF